MEVKTKAVFCFPTYCYNLVEATSFDMYATLTMQKGDTDVVGGTPRNSPGEKETKIKI